MLHLARALARRQLRTRAADSLAQDLAAGREPSVAPPDAAANLPRAASSIHLAGAARVTHFPRSRSYADLDASARVLPLRDLRQAHARLHGLHLCSACLSRTSSRLSLAALDASDTASELAELTSGRLPSRTGSTGLLSHLSRGGIASPCGDADEKDDGGLDAVLRAETDGGSTKMTSVEEKSFTSACDAVATCQECATCAASEAAWRRVSRRLGGGAACAVAVYCFWIRFVARPETARAHVFRAVRAVGSLFRFRVEHSERIPRTGAALICCYHGFVPLDMYFFHEWVHRATGRIPTTLVANFVFRLPLFGWLVRLCGGVPASRANALKALREQGLVIVAPGGVREAMLPTSDDYKLTWFGRQGFAETAMRAAAPIIPMATRNVRELFLVLGGDWPLVQRLYQMTKLPFTPFVGPLLLPLTTLLGEPLPHDPCASSEELAERVRGAMRALLLRATAAQ